ncbi:hypothetical protein QFZ91_002482 [Paraburkholderia sp. JPY419]
MTGVEVMPIVFTIWPQPRSSLGVSPLPSVRTCHRVAPVSASNAYTVSFSVATYSTLCVPPAIASEATNSGCASTLPSTLKKPTLPNFAAVTLAGVSVVSPRFWPVRAMSL